MPAARRYRPRKRELKDLALLASAFGVPQEVMERVEIFEFNWGKAAVVDGRPLLFWEGEKLYPAIPALLRGARLPRVIVDMGAVPHVASGADVMGPGVTAVDPGIKEGDPVAVVDEKHGKPIAVGVALVPSDNMKAPKGKVVKTLHHVGDKIWSLSE
ncbi:MAG: PUA domain-containing protein [Candidatus Hadarchaeales archaeon]